MGGQNMTFNQLTDFVKYKYGLICLAEDSTGKYCSDVEDSWNITTIVAQGHATWPQHTKKCYMDANNFHWDYVTDEEGNCTFPFENNIWQNASDVAKPGQMAAMDYYMDVLDPIDDDNYGWPLPLEYDEYPLEIQCSSCFQKLFEYGHTSIWGDPWDDLMEQVWSNMKLNCNLNKAIVAANNMSGTLDETVDFPAAPVVVDMADCPQVINTTTNQTCASVTLAHQIPLSGLRNLNNDLTCSNLGNSSLCAPISCPMTVWTGNTTSLSTVIRQYTNFTQQQFLGWNKYINTDVISYGETICVGPPGGIYITPNGTQADPSVYTTTGTHPSPTPVGTIPNCGLYYEVVDGDYCNLIALKFSITFSALINMNPSLDSACSNLLLGYDYCVAPVNGTGVPVVTSTRQPGQSTTSSSKPTSGSIKTSSTITPSSSTKASSSTKTTASPVATPTPTQAGMVSGCKKFYKAISGDGCWAIANANGITLDQFVAWNPAVKSDCSGLWPDYYYCIGT
ncbi:hypothetical protein BDV96DRAFT_641641 [Lophiotrema nucula]|uniref:LysM domain-containing protein n=1 Tax=Lophiotrema nucula TaxID=690887 RepID=A0A6A5ZPU1_9PLEO|nr:hypothetical protein BDV96DRAFT_641641 [Lophiotrema nucula]